MRKRLGPHYPAAALLLGFVLLYAFFLAAVAWFLIYVDASTAEALRLVLFILLQQTVYTALLGRSFLRGLRPVRDWLAAPAPGPAASAAWEAAAGFPRSYLRLIVSSLFPLWGAVAFAAYATWELELNAWEFLVVVGAGLVSVTYAVSAFFLTIERAMRPLLADIGGFLSPDDQVRVTGPPLRRRLLILLTGLNLVSGLAVAGLTASSQADLSDLAVALGVSLLVALTFGLYLGLLLSDSIATPVHELEKAADSVGRGQLRTRAAVLSTDEIGSLTESFNRMTRGLRERERLSEAFGAFVDPDLAERILEEGTDLQGEETELSVLILDVRDFTQLSERQEAKAVVGQLNALYEVVVPEVARHGGHANKFIGDGMMAVFGAPERLDDHAERAVTAALSITAALRRDSRSGLRVGIGVNSAQALVATVGGGGRLDFTVIGDVVNTAALIEGATRDTEDDVLVGEATYKRLPNSNSAWPERRLTLKGKSEPVVVYAPHPLAVG